MDLDNYGDMLNAYFQRRNTEVNARKHEILQKEISKGNSEIKKAIREGQKKIDVHNLHLRKIEERKLTEQREHNNRELNARLEREEQENKQRAYRKLMISIHEQLDEINAK